MTDCVVVGAGPAGLATRPHSPNAVSTMGSERGQVGDRRRTQRWDPFGSIQLCWMNQLLGEQERYAYSHRAEVVQKLEHLVATRRFTCRTRGALVPSEDGYALQTSDEEFRSRTVVVVTGDQMSRGFPRWPAGFLTEVAKYHTADHAGSGQVLDGAVLVVGSGQSGCQITEDPLVSGRRVVLATSPARRLPWRHRGRDSLEWLIDAGFLLINDRRMPDPSVVGATQPIVASGAAASAFRRSRGPVPRLSVGWSAAPAATQLRRQRQRQRSRRGCCRRTDGSKQWTTSSDAVARRHRPPSLTTPMHRWTRSSDRPRHARL